jgi:hypothetical protein
MYLNPELSELDKAIVKEKKLASPSLREKRKAMIIAKEREKIEKANKILTKWSITTEEQLLASLEQQTNFEVLFAAVNTLGESGSEKAMYNLLSIINQEQEAFLPAKGDNPDDFTEKLEGYVKPEIDRNQKMVDLAAEAIIALSKLAARVNTDEQQRIKNKILRLLSDSKHNSTICAAARAFEILSETINVQDVKDVLLAHIKETPYSCVKEQLIETAGRLGFTELIPYLLDLLRFDQNENILEVSAEAIADIGNTDENLISELIEIAKETTNWKVRAWIIWTLGELGSEEALSFVLFVANGRKGGSELWVRQTAKEALQKIRMHNT